MMPRSYTNKNQYIYQLAAISILAAVLLFRRNFAAEMHIANGFGLFTLPDPVPTQATDWMALFRSQPTLAFIMLDGVDVINYILLCPLFIALFLTTKKEAPRLITIALILGLAGNAAYILSNRALPFLFLHLRAVSTKTALPQNDLHALADSILTNPARPIGMMGGLILVLISGCIFSIVMLHSKQNQHHIAVIGLLTNGLYLLNYLITPFFPSLNWLFPTLSAPFRIAWYIMLAVFLWKVSRTNPENGKESHASAK